jgi:histidine ammonia-lyase
MGCNAAMMTRKVIENSFDVLSVQLLAVVQAIDYLKCQPRLSSFSLRVYEEVRQIVGPIIEDKAHYRDLQKVNKYISTLGKSVKFE